ncbi:unnamed protein product, partial [Coccothraustes coccothraustes]
ALRLLPSAAAPLQTPRGQHLPRGAPGGAGEVQHGEADVLRAVGAGEAGSHRRLPVRAPDARRRPPPLRVGAGGHGGAGPAAAGVPLPEHQPVRGELPHHGGQTARVRQARPADPGHQLLCEVCQHRGGHALVPPQLRLLRVALQRDVPLGPRRPRRERQ